MAVAKKKSKKESKPKAKENRGSVLINFVLDKSGSMGSCVDDTISGFNTYIKKLKEDKKSSYKFSLTLFDTRFEERFVSVDLKDVPDLNTANYIPGGGTALYDAIGHSVNAIEKKGDTVGKVLTVILTDGQENSSREYRLQMIKDLITRKEGQGNWTFVFLGADLTAFAVGDAMGVNLLNSVTYDTQNVHAAYANTACATMAFSASPLMRTSDFYSHVPMRKMVAAGMSRRLQPKMRTR
jgi:uncharacterized protein YegL